MSAYEFTTKIDDVLYDIEYDSIEEDNYAGEWNIYASLTQVRTQDGKLVNIDSDEEFYNKCQDRANEDLAFIIEDYETWCYDDGSEELDAEWED
jgi:hypothetical protein